MIIDTDDGGTINTHRRGNKRETARLRGAYARALLKGSAYESHEPGLATQIQDLMTDLRHLCDEERLNYDEIDKRARRNFLHEK